MRRLALLLTVLLAACDSAPKPTPARSQAPSTAPPGSVSACPVTTPVVAPDPPVPEGALFGYSSAYGNAGLWVGGLGKGGILELEPEADGYLGTKFGWYRIAEGKLEITGRRLDGSEGKLEITGRRLDGSEDRPVRPIVPDGYGSRGFQSSGISFPGEGCWEVTGKVGATALVWVTYVRSAR